MLTPTAKIRQYFDQMLLDVLPSLNLDGKTDVAWTNAIFKPDATKLYLQPFYLLNPTRNASLGTDGFEYINGIYQINICAVKETSTALYEEIAIKLVDNFRGGTRFDCCGVEVRITSAYYGSVYTDTLNNRLICPISIVWYCYTSKG